MPDDAELEADFRSTVTPGTLLFRRLQAREELGRLPEYRVDLLRPNDDPNVKVLEAKDLLGKAAGVDILLKAGGPYRQINGLVTRFEKGGVKGHFDLYHVELRPWLWQLTLGSDCRIFQNKSALEIITSVFAEYKSASAVEDKVSPKPAKRPFTVQYRESDYNFVSRLMKRKGSTTTSSMPTRSTPWCSATARADTATSRAPRCVGRPRRPTTWRPTTSSPTGRGPIRCAR
jgi:type VI secretion system secreted protein VgrG